MAGRVRHRVGVALLVTALACGGCGQGHLALPPTCTSGQVVLTTEQAANAATIAAVGKRLGVPDHGITVALATAFQESKLRNLDYGDRDSLGLFQQRPSQGWGTAEEVQTPRLAAAAFFAHLRRIPGWRTLPVTEAAQRVQHSGAPDAYAQWEDASRTLAQALTGEVPAGLACQFVPPKAQTPAAFRVTAARLRQQAVDELGPSGLARARVPSLVWSTATWLVAQAASYGVTTVSVSGRTWTAKRGAWVANPAATSLTWS